MIVECKIDDLLELIGTKMSLSELEETLFLLKAEVEDVKGNQIQIEINPDRQDMLSAEGIARVIKSFIGINTEPHRYAVAASGKKIIVKRGLARIRRYISCGIVKGIQSHSELIKEYMRLQEALTSTHGRNRRNASIGLYVHDDLEFPVKYYAEKPEKIEFVPLGNQETMTAPEILRKHEKGQEFGYIIEKFKKWPLLVDDENKILSLPPIINSNDLGRITEETENIFVEVTGTHLPTVNQALNIMLTSLVERGGTIESVEVHYPDGKRVITPSLEPTKMHLGLGEIHGLIGLDLTTRQVLECLRKMGYGGKAIGKGTVEVEIPPYRVDVLHVVDVIEDVAIGYGFDKIQPTMPETMTRGKLLSTTRLKDKIRDLLIGAGYQEILSYILSSPEILNEKMLRDRALVRTLNPKSRDYSVLRNSLLPILLDFVSQNQHTDYPQKIFEIGDIVIPDKEKETRTKQVPSVAGVIIDSEVNLTILMNELGFLLRNLGLEEEFSFTRSTDTAFIDGRYASIEVAGKSVGYFGQIGPLVLKNFNLSKPVIGFEMELASKGIWDL
ncbi:phenylalanine--tRNA ligase subunit beta [Candidatus Thorarchaeota archaeon]|nr:MAG: phenylalanine--tRNA ligase subunit beta [Candidatus Thorarchaeota archaeon]